MTEHRAIWLEPSCCAEAGEDRHWCQDDAWGPCAECGTKPIKYIVASEHVALVAALEEIEDLGANGATAARLGNIAHAALIAIRHPVGGAPKP